MKRNVCNLFLFLVVLLSATTRAQVYNNVYYNSINPSSSTFITDIENRIRTPYIKYGYDQYASTILENFESRDTTGGKKVITCVYSGENFVYTPPFAWGTYSREHTWCHSWMPTFNSESGQEYSDQHHLFPANQSNANGPRSNHPLGNVVTATYQYLEGKLGTDANGGVVYEPRKSHKGDAARALLYMAVKYDGVNGTWNFNWLNNRLASSGEAPQNLATLLEWNKQDPPDMWEIKRNNYIESTQKNRNPFVDHPEYVNYIDFNTLNYKTPVLAVEPANQFTNITSSVTDTTITFKWTKAETGTQAPAGYFITVYKDSNFVIPVDGYAYAEQKDMTKGYVLVYIPYSSADSLKITGLTSATSYLFTAYSYNGTGELINYKTNGTIPQVFVKTSGKAIPVVGFSQQNATISEDAGTFSLQLTISSTADLSADAKINVALKSGNNKYIGGFTSKDITFTPNGSTTLSIPLAIIDDSILEGTRTLVFSIQSLTSNIKLGQTDFNLIINDNDGTSGGHETFANFPETGQSYNSGSFIGQDGSNWTYTFCSGASTGYIDGHNPLLGKGKSPSAQVESGIIQGGCGVLLFKYMQAFSSNVDLSVYVNNNLITKVASNSEVSKIKQTDTIKVNVEGPFTLKFQQTSASSGQVSIGDIVWSGYQVVSVKENNKIPESFLLAQNYPNPFNPETTIGYSIPTQGHVTLSVYNSLGQLVSTLVNEFENAGNYKVKFNAKNLSSGIYFYRISCGNFSAIKKLILVK